MNILNYSPGQKVTIFLEISDEFSHRLDPIGLPVISKIMLPDFTNDGYDGYALPMNRLDPGLYSFQFLIPTGATSVGSYFIEASYVHPVSGTLSTVGYQIVVSAPFGLYATTVGAI